MELPPGVQAEVPPPADKRIAIGGRFLDEVRIRFDATSYLGFPVESFSGGVDANGRATLHAKLPAALQLFADGTLAPVNGAPVEVAINGRDLGPMVLVEVRCAETGPRRQCRAGIRPGEIEASSMSSA